MSRPKKTGLSYFPFDVDFFSDTKIKRLHAKFGTNGISIYIFLLCEIYRRGYYIGYDDDTVTDIAFEFNLSENLTRQIMNYLFSRSLLVMIESKLAVPVKVITAKSVQLRYQEAKKGAKRDIYVDERIWLLKKEETEPFIKMHPSENNSGKNYSYSEKNDSKSEKNHTKESKVKESKVKESKVCSGIVIPCKNGDFIIDDRLLSDLTHTYPEMDVGKALDKLRSYLGAHPEKQGSASAAWSYVEMWLTEDNNAGKYRKKKPDTYEATYDLSEYESTSVLDEDW